jgi:hypothetical protein
VIEQSGGYRTDGVDAACDNGLPGGALSSGLLPTCPNCDDGVFCNGVETCNQTTAACVAGTPEDCDDGASCTMDVCDTEADACVNTPDDGVCDDQDVCTDNICDPESATSDAITGCDFPTADPLPSECVPPEGDFVCRTCGFWKNHPDLTQELLDDAIPPIAVCGGPEMDTTDPRNDSSASEAICVKVKGKQYRQLARQLTCLALNCQFSGGEEPLGLIPVSNQCTGQSTGGQDLGDLFAECDLACATAAGGGSDSLVESCIDRVDCINNGGTPVETSPGNWTCAGGECSIDEELCGFDEGGCAADECEEGTCTLGGNPCTDDEDCVATQSCDLFEAENCHQRDLCPENGTYCFEPPGSAEPGDCQGSNRSPCSYADGNCPL